MGRIPIAESDIGVWSPIDDDYYFLNINSHEFDWLRESWEKYRTVYGRTNLRTSTFAEFKIAFPYTVHSNGSQICYRSKKKPKTW